MLIGGLAFLWFYSRLSQTFDLQSLAMLQQSISRAAFADWQKIAVVAFLALVMALVARSKKRGIPSLVSAV